MRKLIEKQVKVSSELYIFINNIQLTKKSVKTNNINIVFLLSHLWDRLVQKKIINDMTYRCFYHLLVYIWWAKLYLCDALTSAYCFILDHSTFSFLFFFVRTFFIAHCSFVTVLDDNTHFVFLFFDLLRQRYHHHLIIIIITAVCGMCCVFAFVHETSLCCRRHHQLVEKV